MTGDTFRPQGRGGQGNPRHGTEGSPRHGTEGSPRHGTEGSPRRVTDDLGVSVGLPAGALTRVVSLVPSLTEALAATRRETLVGVTDWCTHPADLDVARVRGTKNPDRRAIEALSPELVICVQEENRELDVRRLREAGIPVWVGVIESVDDALRVLRSLFDEVLGWGEPEWLAETTRLLGGGQGDDEGAGQAGREELHTRVAVPIWRDPWMVVGSANYTSDLLGRLGIRNVFGEHEQRYPHVEVEQIDDAGADLVLLPDEPYVFTDDDGPEAFARTPTRLVSGRLLTWYGPAMLEAWEQLARR